MTAQGDPSKRAFKLTSSVEIDDDEKRIHLNLPDVYTWLLSIDKENLHEAMFPIGSCNN